eukprot:m51a1_g10907 putative membrane-anchored adenylyl cyclase cya (393) ;mRNA; r:58048-62722
MSTQIEHAELISADDVLLPVVLRPRARHAVFRPTRGGPCGSIRVRVLFAALFLLAGLAALTTGSVVAFSERALAEIERNIALADTRVALRAIDDENTAIVEMLLSWEFWDDMFNYVYDGDPNAAFFHEFANAVNMECRPQFYNGVFYDWNSHQLMNVSVPFSNAIGESLKATGVAYGVLEEPLTVADTILSNMFPQHIYCALLEGRQPEDLSETYDNSCVMFSEVCGFGLWAASASPSQVVRFLNLLIGEFDTIAESHGVTKIKMLRNVFLAVCGIPAWDASCPREMARMALEFTRASNRLTLGDSPVQVHSGISSGPVTAGIIGKVMWIYDIWSDTVNMAARLKAAAGPGSVLCCFRTYTALRDSFSFAAPLDRDVKGKGMQQLFPLIAEK